MPILAIFMPRLPLLKRTVDDFGLISVRPFGGAPPSQQRSCAFCVSRCVLGGKAASCPVARACASAGPFGLVPKQCASRYRTPCRRQTTETCQPACALRHRAVADARVKPCRARHVLPASGNQKSTDCMTFLHFVASCLCPGAGMAMTQVRGRPTR